MNTQKFLNPKIDKNMTLNKLNSSDIKKLLDSKSNCAIKECNDNFFIDSENNDIYECNIVPFQKNRINEEKKKKMRKI